VWRDDEIPVEYKAEDADAIEAGPNTSQDLQTFVLSATLSKDLQRNLKKRWRPKVNKKRKGKDDKPASTLGMIVMQIMRGYSTQRNPNLSDDLLLRLDFRDPEPEVIDLSPEGKIVSTLQEAKIECLTNDKVLSNFHHHKPLSSSNRICIFIISSSGTLAARWFSYLPLMASGVYCRFLTSCR
jgi:ATP-dependent RNA helicase DDX24/MAK5